MKGILFVCIGNICRSPSLHGFLEDLLKKKGLNDLFHIESCAIDSYHIGENVDKRMQSAAFQRNVHLSHKAILLEPAFFYAFDYIFAATKEIKTYLEELSPNDQCMQKIYLATHFSKKFKDQDIPDPYFGKERGFEQVLDIIEECCDGILKAICQK